MNDNAVKILSILLFDIFKYEQDPKGENDFPKLRQLYRELPLEMKRQITKEAIRRDPEFDLILDAISQERSRYLYREAPEISRSYRNG